MLRNHVDYHVDYHVEDYHVENNMLTTRVYIED